MTPSGGNAGQAVTTPLIKEMILTTIYRARLVDTQGKYDDKKSNWKKSYFEAKAAGENMMKRHGERFIVKIDFK